MMRQTICGMRAGAVAKHTDSADQAYAYDFIDQLTNAAYAYRDAVATQGFAYAYDTMGNRRWASSTGSMASVSARYGANSLNQYTNMVTEREGGSMPAAPGYDLNGNLTNDGVRVYTWSIENRLMSVTPLAPTNGSLRCVFAYDYQGRRIRKQTFEWQGAQWVSRDESRFLYDGWNLIAESRVSGAASNVNSYVWGLDLSGTLQGAGGVGGLLAAQLGTSSASNDTTVFPVYDYNGNIEKLISASGATVAAYEYDPFGNVLVASGPQAKDNPFRFSTKYTDDETGLVYYGYRYYAPEMGRWVNRDPLGERGGVNLVAFVGNNPVLIVDTDGRGWFAGPGQPSGGRNAPSITFPETYPLQPPVYGEFDRFYGGQDGFGLSSDDRRDWFWKFMIRYGSSINSAADRNCVPRKLLAAMVVNERLQQRKRAWLEEDYLEGSHWRLMNALGYGESVGVAQAQIVWVTDKELRRLGVAPGMAGKSKAEIAEWLQDDANNIETAAQAMKAFMSQLCKAGANGKFSKEFKRLFIDSNSETFRKLCCGDCNALKDIDPTENQLFALGAMWNGMEGIWAREKYQDLKEGEDDAALNADTNRLWLRRLRVSKFFEMWGTGL